MNAAEASEGRSIDVHRNALKHIWKAFIGETGSGQQLQWRIVPDVMRRMNVKLPGLTPGAYLGYASGDLLRLPAGRQETRRSLGEVV
jgi:hypothetical protein